MSSFLKSIGELTWPTQIILLILTFLIILNIIVFKFSIKKWQQFTSNPSSLSNQTNNNRQTQCKQIVTLLIKVYTFIQPFITNMSANKVNKITILFLWTYMLLCTQIFITLTHEQIYAYQLNNQINLTNINFIRVFTFLSWNGFALVFVDVFMRYISANYIVQANQSQKTRGKKQIKITQSLQTVNDEIDSKTNIQDTRIQLKILIYYCASLMINIGLFFMIITHLINSKSIKIYKPIQMMNNDIISINFYSKVQSILKVSKMCLCLIILILFHQVLIVFSGGLTYAILNMLECKLKTAYLWEIVFGYESKFNGRKVAHFNEQSMYNLGYLTQRNKIESLFFSQNRNTNQGKSKKGQSLESTLEKPNSLILYQRNKGGRKRLQQIEQSYCIKDVLGKEIQERKESLTVNNSIANTISVNRGKKDSREPEISKTLKLEQNLQRKVQNTNKKGKKKKIITFFQENEMQKPEQVNEKSQKRNIITKPKNTQQQYDFTTSEPVLRNIQNKILSQNLKKQKKQLKVINFGEYEQGIDFIDLSQYVVSDLGCVKTPTSSFRKAVLTSNKKEDTNKSSINSNSKTCKKNSFSYKRNRNQRTDPSFPDVNIEPPTFCLSDLS